ncbi:MAG: hypothetical protein V4582_15125 [Pseudomonadota bacterium]
MLITWRRAAAGALVLLLAACATVVPGGSDCVGVIGPAPAGLREVQDETLRALALGAPDKGALCAGKVYVAEKAVTVYRVWDAAKPFTLYGRWWSFTRPQGPRAQYQRDNAICPEWSALDKMSACTIKVGSKIVTGPGQSAQCEQFVLPQSPVNQVFIANDGLSNVLYVESCDEGSVWP